MLKTGRWTTIGLLVIVAAGLALMDPLAADTNETALGFQSPAAQLSAGANHTCALLYDGDVQCWGSNQHGQVGSTEKLGAGGGDFTSPQPAVALPRDAVAISSGTNHTCALLDNGTVQCWGGNRYGTLGSPTNVGSTDPNPNPLSVVPLPGEAVAISAGVLHTCALLNDGGVRCWGKNEFGQLGFSTASPNQAYPSPDTPIAFGTTPSQSWPELGTRRAQCSIPTRSNVWATTI